MILPGLYTLTYLKTVVSVVECIEKYSTKKVVKIALSESPDCFGIVFANNDTPVQE